MIQKALLTRGSKRPFRCLDLRAKYLEYPQSDSISASDHHSDGIGDGADDVSYGAADDVSDTADADGRDGGAGDVSDEAGDDGDGVAEVMNVVTSRGHPGAASSA